MGNLVRETAELAYKSVGTTSSLPGSQAVLTAIDGLSCVSQDGQHDCSFIHESSGRNTFSPSIQIGEECPSLGPDKVPIDQSGSHLRSPELRCRPALETEARGQGMETSPSSGESHMAEVRTSGCGSVFFEHDYALPALVRPVSPVASRSGCAGP